MSRYLEIFTGLNSDVLSKVFYATRTKSKILSNSVNIIASVEFLFHFLDFLGRPSGVVSFCCSTRVAVRDRLDGLVIVIKLSILIRCDEHWAEE